MRHRPYLFTDEDDADQHVRDYEMTQLLWEMARPKGWPRNYGEALRRAAKKDSIERRIIGAMRLESSYSPEPLHRGPLVAYINPK